MGQTEFRQSSERLALTGALVEVAITVPVPLKRFLAREALPAHAIVRGHALIDTGAAVSAVDESVMEALGIPAVDGIETLSPHGLGLSNVYNASASFPQLGWEDVSLEAAVGCHVREGEIAEGIDVLMLIGRDLLQQMRLTYDGPSGLVSVEV